MTMITSGLRARVTVEVKGEKARLVMEGEASITVDRRRGTDRLELEGRIVGREPLTNGNPADPLDHLHAELDRGMNLTLSGCADRHEERGEGRMAAGYRWLAALGKHPAGDRGLYFWMAPRGSDAMPPHLPGSASARLPRPVHQQIARESRWVIGRNRGEFETQREAWQAAADAVGRWLAEGGEP